MSEGAQKRQEKPRRFQAIKGTRDLLPPETALWNRVEQTAHEVFSTFGFGEIRPPIFEPNELFARSIGLDTDVVSKEMYSFEDRPDARLERYKYILNFETTSFEMNAIRAQVHDLEIVLSDLRAASRQGDVPDTPGNQRGLENLGILIGELAGHVAEKKLLSEGELARKLAAIQRIGSDLELAERMSLRPEATASVCRAYIEHSMQQLPQPVKLYYMGPMFRRERPQKGRYRQFYQIGAEVLGGSDAPAIDAEVIEMVMEFFDRLELQGVQLDINSIGDRNCRPKYVELLRAELLKVKDKLGPDSQRRIETNPLRVLDSKVKEEQSIIENLPRIGDHLCKDCALHYADVKHELELRGVKYRENWRLVRGLDYYMRTTFEITAKGLGSQNAVCGGGRYDGLVELLGGPPTKGIGFAIGEDRLILSLQEGSQRRSS